MMPNPNGPPKKGARVAPSKKGAIRACCFLRRHDPSRFEGSSGRIAPQSQSSAEDTPTGKAEQKRDYGRRKNFLQTSRIKREEGPAEKKTSRAV